jgi:hypothetical protein
VIITHGGKVSALHQPDGGLLISIDLPQSTRQVADS